MFRSTVTVEDIFDKLEGWNRNDVQLEHSKDYTIQKLLLHSENPIELKEKVQSIELVNILLHFVLIILFLFMKNVFSILFFIVIH